MGQRTSYAPGTFSWADLATSDADGAKAFYSALFGWTYEDLPVGEGMVYSMARHDGRTAAALSETPDQPPHWNCYVTVESVDASTARAKDLGANVMAEPFDVMDAGRMSIIVDPTDAALCLWEPGRNPGAAVVNEPGALTWVDLVTEDAETAARFYGELFGWTTQEIPGAGGYRIIRNGERNNGGIMPHPGFAAFTPYFGCEDLDATLAQVKAEGGRVLQDPMQLPAGRIAVVADPQGAVFALWSGAYAD